MSKIVIFTDLHYGEDIRGKQKDGINTHGATDHLLEELCGNINQMSLECVINLWDLAYGSTRETKLACYRDVKTNFLDLLLPRVIHMLWNHEFFIATKEEVQEILWNMNRESFIVWKSKHIILDIALSKNRLFEISRDTIAWLRRELEFDGEIIIYCHFPITEDKENVSYVFGQNGHKAFLENSKEIKDLLKGSNCKYWISGHTHFLYETEIDGIQHVTLPSFSEDNVGKPNAQYAVFDTETMILEIKHIR